MRCGSGRRAIASNAKSFTMSPKYDGQLLAVALLDRGRARLGELSGDPADLHRRHAGAVGEHHRHLQDHLELVADVVGRELRERLRAVARVEQEAVALADRGERFPQRTRLAREHERRHATKLVGDAFEVGRLGPVGLVRGRAPTPARGFPVERAEGNGCRHRIRDTRRARARRCRRERRASAGCACLRTGAAPASVA